MMLWWLLACLCAGAVVLILYIAFVPSSKAPAPPGTCRRGVVRLHTFGRFRTSETGPVCMLDASPFVAKLETYLRMARIPYETVPGIDSLGRGMSSKNKMPWIELDGEVVCDSQVCIEFLQKRFPGRLLDMDEVEKKGSDPGRGASLHAARKMIDEALYWGVIKHRYTVVGYKHIRAVMASCVPAWAVVPVTWYCRFTVGVVQLWGQGYGRHSKEEVYRMDAQDLLCLSQLLGKRDYFGGSEPCTMDAAAYGILSGIVHLEWGGPDRDVVLSLPNLMQYLERIGRRYWPDWSGRDGPRGCLPPQLTE